jgi:RimJ/RimL family protein N-acetyltransferase
MNSQLAQTNLFTGSLVRLAAMDPDRDPATTAAWFRNTEFARLLDSDPARPRTTKDEKEDMEKRAVNDNGFSFAIRALEGDKLIGFVGLWTGTWASAEGWLGIGIGEPDYWGKGYGTDAMRLVLRFAFHELNLERVSLEAFAHNTRAIRSYEKSGFRLEGVQREWEGRDGERRDVVGMGILRTDWEARSTERQAG